MPSRCAWSCSRLPSIDGGQGNAAMNERAFIGMWLGAGLAGLALTVLLVEVQADADLTAQERGEYTAMQKKTSALESRLVASAEQIATLTAQQAAQQAVSSADVSRLQRESQLLSATLHECERDSPAWINAVPVKP